MREQLLQVRGATRAGSRAQRDRTARGGPRRLVVRPGVRAAVASRARVRERRARSAAGRRGRLRPPYLPSVAFRHDPRRGGSRHRGRTMGVGRLKGTDMKVAVTGGSGFIGTHVVDHLVAQGHQVIVLDRAAPTHRADVEFRELDILDIDGLVAGTRGCDVVFHLAAVSNVNIAFDHPVATIEVNVTGTTNVWEAARRNEVGRAVLASTVWVYAAAPEVPGATDDAVDETAWISLADAGHLYTASKIAAELVVHSYWELYAQPFTILRY